MLRFSKSNSSISSNSNKLTSNNNVKISNEKPQHTQSYRFVDLVTFCPLYVCYNIIIIYITLHYREYKEFLKQQRTVESIYKGKTENDNNFDQKVCYFF